MDVTALVRNVRSWPAWCGRRHRSAGSLPAAARGVAAVCLLLGGGTAVAGCAQEASAAVSIQLGTAYINVPGADSDDTTDAYLQIQNNNGIANRLTAARTSVRGRVTFRAPVRAGSTAMRTVPDIPVPADSLLRLSPNGPHLLISGAGPMQAGRQITLTLVFARGGTMSVAAEVTNPATGGSSYFLN
jgi:copper(I)-binding protein